MMTKVSLKLVCMAMLFAIHTGSFAQQIENEFNDNSLRPIRNADVMLKKTVWLRADLRQKQNQPFYASENEISKVIIDAVKAGILRPFSNDSLNTRLTQQAFLERLSLPTIEDDEILFPELSDEGWDTGFEDSEDPWAVEEESIVEGANEFFPHQLFELEIKQDVLFDRKRSRNYNDIQAITIIIPGEYNPTGIEKVLGSFSYKELVENVFEDNPQAIAYNAHNTIEHRNLADAFDLALHAAHIVKYSNPLDQLIVDVYSGNSRLALGKAQEFEHQMMEEEHHLWSN